LFVRDRNPSISLDFFLGTKNQDKIGPEKNLKNYIFDCKAEGIIRVEFIFPNGMLN